MKVYTEDERQTYEPPPCPGCGCAVEQEWVNVGTAGNPDTYMPGLWRCNAQGCQYGPPKVEVF